MTETPMNAEALVELLTQGKQFLWWRCNNLGKDLLTSDIVEDIRSEERLPTARGEHGRWRIVGDTIFQLRAGATKQRRFASHASG